MKGLGYERRAEIEAYAMRVPLDFPMEPHQRILPPRERPGQGTDGAQGTGLPCDGLGSCWHPAHPGPDRRLRKPAGLFSG